MIDEVTKARLAIGLPSNRFFDAGDNVKCPLMTQSGHGCSIDTPSSRP
jgi:hypothetical protein